MTSFQAALLSGASVALLSFLIGYAIGFHAGTSRRRRWRG